MNRKQIETKLVKNLKKITDLKNENIKLAHESYLLSDDKQQFTEEIEHIPCQKYVRKPHWLDGKLVGKIHWKEYFKDDDSNELIEIKRSKIVRIDGEWV